ncbi:hypothetical protein [Hyunsoonleella ulvae]|uniref:hypothetical protein n=1 Tax=Hyunsoonleella ulvae TaxID=2799948 RepID=UPI0019395F73|nr:hypothetical protein [Hyunsoonleella ulvae]
MKYILNYKFLLIIGVVFVSVIVACDGKENSFDSDIEQEDPVDPDPDDPEQTGSISSSNDISAALLLSNAEFRSGSAAASGNLSDLKIDKDTINLWPGVKSRVRILNRDQVSIKNVLIHILGANGYYTMPIVEEESIDSISVFYIDINPKDLDLPYEGKIVISPTDTNGGVIDEFEMPVLIDPPFDEDIGAGPDGNEKGNCPIRVDQQYYLWIYTTIDGEFFDAPGYPKGGTYETMGCCDRSRIPEKSVPCLGKPPTEVLVVRNDYSLTNLEYIKLHQDDYFYGYNRTYNSFNYSESDFCKGAASYSQSKIGLQAFGQFSYEPANDYGTFYKFIIKNLDYVEREPGNFANIGPNESFSSIEAYISCKYIIWTTRVEGSVTTRVFERGENDWFF